MRRLLALALCFLLFTTEVFAKAADWQNLSTLTRGDVIALTMKDGAKLSGNFDSFSETSLRMTDYSDPNASLGTIRDVERDRIRKVVRVNHQSLPNPGKLVGGGALLGGTLGAISGAAIAPARASRGAGAFYGGLAGAGLGMLTAGIIGVGIGVHAMRHHNTTIYESR